MIRFFVMRWNAIERVLDQHSIARESLQQPRRVVISHHGDFIGRFQSIYCFERRVMHLVAKWIEAAAAINQQQHRKRQTVLTEMRDLLLRSIFVKQKIFFLQTADDACSVLLQHQRVNSDQIDVYLYDFRRRRDRGRLVRTVTINDFGKLLVRVDSSVSCLRSDRRMRREKENCNDERGNCNEKKKCRVSMLHKRSPSRKQC